MFGPVYRGMSGKKLAWIYRRGNKENEASLPA